MLTKIEIPKSIYEFSKSPCDEPLFKEICDFFYKSLNNHEASEDIDGDGFSEYEVSHRLTEVLTFTF